MSSFQPLQPNNLVNGFQKVEKDMNKLDRYATASETGLEGPDQVLSTDVDTTCEVNGRVRIKLDSNGCSSSAPMSIPGVLSRTVQRYPDNIALVSSPDLTGKRTKYTFREYEQLVRIVAKAYLKLGLERFHGVCILGFNCPQWFVADIAAIYAGGLAAGIYTTNSPEACCYSIKFIQAQIILVEDEKQLAKILKIKNQLPDVKAIIQYEGVPTEKGVLSWNDLLEIGRQESDDKLQSVLRTMGVNECCSVVYTSGTVGFPKAVMLSHDSLLHDVKLICAGFGIIPTNEVKEVIISYLPLSHIAAQVCDMLLSIYTGSTIYFADKNALKGTLLETLHFARPTLFLGVPRVWEKFYEKMQEKARENGFVKKWIAQWAKTQALQYHTNKMNGIDHKHWGYIIAKWLVFDKVKAALGLDKCQIFVSAAAPISLEIKSYFLSLDIPLLEAYGMSESSGVHTATPASDFRLNGVGMTLPGVYTKLDNVNEHGEGEICMKGRHVFMGYLNAPEKTADAKDKDGWLHSGDIGKLGPDGVLYVTGRIKELIITSGGENIAPKNIEHAILKELPILSNALLIGDKRKFLSVLVTLKSDMDVTTGAPLDTLNPNVLEWTKANGSEVKTVSDVIKTHDPLIYEEIEKAIERANKCAISNAQKVQKFQILPHDFSIPTGELGPTLKLKKNVVIEKYADIIEKMYQ